MGKWSIIDDGFLCTKRTQVLIDLEEITLSLKPIYEKAPLMTLAALPLRAGQCRSVLPQLRRLYALGQAAPENVCLWEGLFRTACLVKDQPLQEPVVRLMNEALSRQQPSGELPGSVAEQVALMRAAYAVYEFDTDRVRLEKMALWCGWACENWENVLADREVRVRPGELMELLCSLYRITGKAALMELCKRLRAQGMDWTSVLHTFSQQRPLMREMPFDLLQAHMADEREHESGYYTRLYLTNHSEYLADGVRSAVTCGRFSGSGSELSAPRTGWEKITRYHGAVCGGVTGDETLAGASPAAGVSAAGLGAWAESLASVDEPWAYDALEVLVANALPVAAGEEEIQCVQQVNQVGESRRYHLGADLPLRSLNRLMRGYAAVASCAVTQRPEGPAVNLYLPGEYIVPAENGAMLLKIREEKGEKVITVRVKEAFRAEMKLRVPKWARETTVSINGLPMDAACENLEVEIDRVWENGDTVTVAFSAPLQELEGYHQGACIMAGPVLYAMDAASDSPNNVALCGEPVMDGEGRITAPVRLVPDWKNTTGDIPVLPRTEGDVLHVALVPYADAKRPVALFPRGKQA